MARSTHSISMAVQKVLLLAFSAPVAGVALIQITMFSLASWNPGCDPSGNKANVFSSATPGAIIWSSGIDHSFSPSDPSSPVLSPTPPSNGQVCVKCLINEF